MKSPLASLVSSLRNGIAWQRFPSLSLGIIPSIASTNVNNSVMSATVRQVGQFLGLVFAVLLCAAPAQSAVLIHEYALRGALTDSKNGPALVQNGGSITPNGYVFGANQGVS